MIRWLRALFSRPAPVPRELVVVGWEEGDQMLRQGAGWRIAPEEDHNPSRKWVWLERDAACPQPTMEAP